MKKTIAFLMVLGAGYPAGEAFREFSMFTYRMSVVGVPASLDSLAASASFALATVVLLVTAGLVLKSNTPHVGVTVGNKTLSLYMLGALALLLHSLSDVALQVWYLKEVAPFNGNANGLVGLSFVPSILFSLALAVACTQFIAVLNRYRADPRVTNGGIRFEWAPVD